MLIFELLSVFTLGVLVAAHPGEEHERLSRSELSRRQAATVRRHLAARRCASAINNYEAFRKQRVMAVSNTSGKPKPPSHTGSAHGPHVTEIKNTTCITAPETIEGPFYIRNEYVRPDLRDNQDGVKLVLDIGVMDTNTCEPLNNVFVELWAANATGIYSGYDVEEEIPGGPPPGQPGGPGGPSHPLSRKETFLRGGFFTDSHGIAEITTIHPGFYRGRAPHIHALVHVDWEESSNGTLVSDAGKLVHVGQFFFEETWNDQVFATSPYTLNKESRTLNKDDRTLEDASADGYNAFVDLALIGHDISEGLYGYITVGVDTTASYTIENTNYNPVVISSLSHGASPSPHPVHGYP